MPTEKQEKLDALCETLLRKKELLNSGRIQLIGLSKVRKRLGRRWKGMAKLVFSIVEEVIGSHLNNKADFFVKYKEANYLVFFDNSNIGQIKRQVALIAHDIQQRLFELDDDALRELEIWKNVYSRGAEQSPSFEDFLESFPSGPDNPPVEMVLPELDEPVLQPKIKSIDVQAEDCVQEGGVDLNEVALPPVVISFRPVWDVKRNALNTFLCMAASEESKRQCLQIHTQLYEQLSVPQQAAMDLHLLRNTISQVKKVIKSGKKMLIGCPLQHQSLYHYGHYIQFRDLLQQIPPEHRGYLIFYIMDADKTLPVKDAYWFVSNLKQYCRFVFAEVPLRQDINFTYLRRQQIDAVGFRLDQIISQKLSPDRMMNLFQVRASAMKIPMTFVFGLTAINNITSTAVAKYDYVSGDVIRKAVKEPSGVEQFCSEDLLVKLVKAEKV